jgi:hypothetical protein
VKEAVSSNISSYIDRTVSSLSCVISVVDPKHFVTHLDQTFQRVSDPDRIFKKLRIRFRIRL